MIPNENRDDAIAAAAQLVGDNAYRCLADTKASAHSISVSRVPFFGINWDKKAISRITSGDRSGTDALNQ